MTFYDAFGTEWNVLVKAKKTNQLQSANTAQLLFIDAPTTQLSQDVTRGGCNLAIAPLCVCVKCILRYIQTVQTVQI